MSDTLKFDTSFMLYKPFEKAMCPVKEEMLELDPEHGISIDGMAVLLRRGELELSHPWALHNDVGFETRFHKVRICNVEFQPLHPGYTQGNMLVEFAEEHRRCINGHVTHINDGQQTDTFDPLHFWFDFMRSSVRNVHLQNKIPYTFAAEVKVNSQWFPSASTTAVGMVVDVMDKDGMVRPCEVPVRARDLDFLFTEDHGPDGALHLYSLRSNEENQNLVQEALRCGKGALSVAKRNPSLFGEVRAPTLQFI